MRHMVPRAKKKKKKKKSTKKVPDMRIYYSKNFLGPRIVLKMCTFFSLCCSDSVLSLFLT